MSNAAIYARFSCSKQREESIEDQVRVCRDAASCAGDSIVAVYADSAMSGRTDDRPQFRQMIADSAKRRWDKIYVYKLDRFARNRYDAAVNKTKLRKNGVSLVSATEHINDGPDGILMEAVLEGMAEYYSAQLSENVRRGIEGKARKCMTNGGPMLYGYRKGPDGKFEIDPDEARAVRVLFASVASGKTITDAISDVKSLGTCGRTRKWSKSTAGALLRREQYIGVYNYAGHRVEGGMPAIIDDETWSKVQSYLNTNKHAAEPGAETYVLSGKLHDRDGNEYVGSSGTGRRGTTYYYYRCLQTGHAIPRDELDDRIARCVAAKLREPGVSETITDMVLAAQNDAMADEMAAIDGLRKSIERNETAQNNTVDAIASIGLNDRLRAKLAELESEHAELAESLAAAERGAPVLTRDMVQFWVRDISCAPDAATLLSAFVSDVVIADNGAVLVAFVLDQDGACSHGVRHPLADGENDGQKTNKPPVKTGGLYKYAMVGDNVPHTNTIIPIIGGFAIVA